MRNKSYPGKALAALAAADSAPDLRPTRDGPVPLAELLTAFAALAVPRARGRSMSGLEGSAAVTPEADELR